MFAQLRAGLATQIRNAGLDSSVEVLSASDNRERPVGAKRNDLVRAARGEFTVQVDDDDRLAPNYVSRICDTLRAHPDIDCVGITGIVSFRGRRSATFIHSLRHQGFETRNGVYLRPPTHLNPVLRRIAVQHPFPEVRYSEDFGWALRVTKHRAFQSEVLLEEPLYFYDSRRYWQYQWLLDRTERVRHALGLTAVNRLRLMPNAGVPPCD